MGEMTAADVGRVGNFSGVRSAENLPNSCRCGARWSGTKTSHCGVKGCHQTFSGVSAFDLHRRGGVCGSPTKLGMSQIASRPYQCWGFPAESGE